MAECQDSFNNDAVLLASGGLDSTVLAYWLLDRKVNFVPLFIDYGQHSADTERERLNQVLPPAFRKTLQQISVRDVYQGCNSRVIAAEDLWKSPIEKKDLYVPGRNLLLLSIGAAFAGKVGAKILYAAFIETNLAAGMDCNSIFLDLVGDILTTTYEVGLRTPFRYYSKENVAVLGWKLGAPIGKTYSCLASPRIPCGACSNCVDRELALQALEEMTHERSADKESC